MIKKLKIKIRKSDTIGVFHDTRGDIRQLAVVCNELIDKINELVDKVNELEEKNKSSI